jgi:CRISPR-associated endonuclease Cas1
VATTGNITVDALRWLEGAGVGLIVLDPSTGRVVTASTRVANDDARLRRAQALAPGTETGLLIVRCLIEAKLTGQSEIAATELNAPGVAERILVLRGMVADSASLEEVRQLEASAANLYWSAWGSVEVSFVTKDAPRVPDNWRRFEGRRSAVNPGSARNASDPINACLNYLYRLVEAEGHLATQTVGLDPGLGVLHADMKSRASFVLDLIESARPIAERHVLRLIRSRPLRWRDFHEEARGVVRVLPPLTHRLAEAMPSFGVAMAPVVEHIAALLAAASPYDVNNPSVLTKEKHKAAARRRTAQVNDDPEPRSARGPNPGGLRSRAKPRQRPAVALDPRLPVRTCRDCGGPLPRVADRNPRNYCKICLAKRRAEQLPILSRGSLKHAAGFAELTGVRPTHTAEASASGEAQKRPPVIRVHQFHQARCHDDLK